MRRRLTRQVKVRSLLIGGQAPISVQSMTNTATADTSATLAQIRALCSAGCELVRVAVPDREAAGALKLIVKESPIPVAADIHFDYRLALMALEAGIDKLRINPGNIGSIERVRAVVAAAKERGVPIRIGVNAGSLEKELLEKYQSRSAAAMVESALRHVRILEDLDFTDTVISLKATDVQTTIEAYELISSKVDYPLHVGITEAGTPWTGTIKSAVGIGSILSRGIGDTLRVSLTGDPVEEVRVGYEILKALGLRKRGATVISCPTCGRCEIDLAAVAGEVEKRVAHITVPITIAVMGCAVNGPGEASEADVGIAAGKDSALLFRRGKKVGKVAEADLVDAIVSEAEAVALERFGGIDSQKDSDIG